MERFWIYLFGLRTTNKLSGTVAGDGYARLVFLYLNPSIYKKIQKNKVGMACAPV
jgi:hypothetical protein